jgi:hypothetical protein
MSKASDNSNLTNSEVGTMIFVVPVSLVMACFMLFFPVVGLYYAWLSWTYHTAPFYLILLGVDVGWGICVRKRWLFKDRRNRVFVTIFLYVLSASIAIDFLLCTALDGAFS